MEQARLGRHNGARRRRRAFSLCLALGLIGCGGQTCGSGEPLAPAALGDDLAGAEAEVPAPGPGTPAPPEAPREESCDDRLERARATIEEAASTHAACRWNVDCAAVGVDASCYRPCAAVVSASGVRAVHEAVSGVDREVCQGFQEAGCNALVSRCALSSVSCAQGRCVGDEGDPVVADVEIPDENRASLSDPPPRPPVGDAEERARRLLDAVVHDDPDRARDFFFPLEAFREVKGIADPDGYWNRLYAAYEQDVHELHESLPDLDSAEFLRLEIVRRGGWVVPREEGNRLPYWAARHSRLHYRVGDDERSFEVRVLITWGTRWYITHLSEFH